MSVKLGKYQHYRGNFYEVIALGRFEETEEEVVIYRALYDSAEFGKNAVWVRKKNVFLENVSINGKQVSRFRFVE